MSSDVVSRLLAAIDERERKARASLGTHWPPEGDKPVPGDGAWTFQGDYDGPRVRAEQTGADVAACLMDDYEHTRMSAEDGEHIAANDPASVLRLCQAHRDIVARYERTKRLLAEANQRVLQHVMDGTVATWREQQDFGARHIEEDVLGEVVEDVARGYGIEDTQ